MHIQTFPTQFIIRVLIQCTAKALYYSKWKRNVILKNLEKIGINWDKSRQLTFYENIAKDLYFFVFSRKIDLITTFRETENLDKLRINGGLMLTGHFGNWELMGRWLVEKGVSLQAYSKPMKSRFANKVLNKLRKKAGINTISYNVIYSSSRWIRKSGTFAILWDQRAKGLTSNFLGLPVELSNAPILIQNRTKCACWAVFLLPNRQIRIIQLFTGQATITSQKLSIRYHKVLGILVTNFPAFWYGLCHRRFKTAFSDPYQDAPLPLRK